jgi:hypothetical protein
VVLKLTATLVAVQFATLLDLIVDRSGGSMHRQPEAGADGASTSRMVMSPASREGSTPSVSRLNYCSYGDFRLRRPPKTHLLFSKRPEVGPPTSSRRKCIRVAFAVVFNRDTQVPPEAENGA